MRRHHGVRRPPPSQGPSPPQQQQPPAQPSGTGLRRLDPASQLQTPPQRVAPATTPPQLNPLPASIMLDPRRAVAAGVIPRFNPSPAAAADTDSDTEEVDEEEGEELTQELEPEQEENEEEMGAEEAEGEEEEVEDEDEEMRDRNRSPSPLPPNLREISSLASWTVSTHKPGCGVAALRNPSPSQYWQSDGPQPHILTLHFFKLVAVVKIRVYLDFELDESYTPTKMVFLAGMGGNDLVEFATWEGEGPCGSSRRRRRRRSSRKRKSKAHDYVFSESENEAYPEDEDEEDIDNEEDDDDDDPTAGNVLKAMVIQMRVCENHQNGKDTHVRGFQVFAQDDDRRRAAVGGAAGVAGTRSRRQSVRKSLRGKDARDEHAEDGDGTKVTGLEEPDWMGEPVIR
ncbi:hypothetical protein VTN00DRAFT_9241 [Thermoascus crustaceus]|uniref:uncharacterized protein n=1 Tax=Thermoascus crustaceus TaxID=5088 RepID=UPI003743873D